MPFGGFPLSRLVAGANPVNGGSHLSNLVNRQFKRYFTPEKIQEYLRRCESAGITAWQAGPRNIDHYRRYRDSGGTMGFIAIVHEGDGDDAIDRLRDSGAMAAAYHGEAADRLYKAGCLSKARGFLERVRDSGMLVGVSTHMPGVIETVESEGWDVDFYMACVYERHRTREELLGLLGYVPIPVNEVYLEEDPPRMWKVIRGTKKPCLAFKILAAGRLCHDPADVNAAFRSAFENIKASDALIVEIGRAHV